MLRSIAQLFATILLFNSQAVTALADCPAQPVYLSDTSETYTYLENLQRDFYNSNPSFRDRLSREELFKPAGAKSWAELTARLEKAGCNEKGENCLGDSALNAEILKDLTCGPLPTRFESPLSFSLLKLSMAEVDPVRKRLFPGGKEITFGSMPTGNIDAQVLLIPDSEDDIVILNRDVYAFTGAFSKAVSDAIPILQEGESVGLSFDPQKIRERIRNNPQILRNFAEATVLLILKQTPSGAKESFLDDDHNRLHARLVGGLDTFVVAHEVAHVALKHSGKTRALFMLNGRLQTRRSALRTRATAPLAITLLERNRQQELAADELGFRFLLESYSSRENNELNLAIAAAGPDIFFGIIELADRYAREFGQPGLSGATHPTARARSAALDKVYAQIAEQNSTLRNMPDFRMLFRNSLLVLSEEADPIIRRLLQRINEEPSP